jgi:hypothetical protein
LKKTLKSRLLRAGAVAVALLTAYLAWDFFPPKYIRLKPDICGGLPCLRARKLIVQELDREGRIWATRGLWAYSRSAGENAFVRRYHIPTGAGLAWLNNFTMVRWLTSRDICVELVNLPDGGVMAQSGPFLWLRQGPAGPWQKSHVLAHYGLGVGRGLMPSGMAALSDHSLLYGEYWRNPTRAAVSLYRNHPARNTWEVAYTFPDRQIRHVHAVQADPYEPKAWVATGDGRREPRLAWTDDGAATLHVVGQGEESNEGQKWRICQLVFTPDSLYWGADTETSESGIYRYDRRTGGVTNLAYVPGAVWFGTRLAEGTIVLSSAVEGYPNEIDKLTRLWIVNTNDQVACIPLGHYHRPMTSGGYGLLRLPHNQGASDLYLTCLNVRDFNGDLLVVSPETLKTRSAPWSADAGRPPAP